MSVTPDDLPSLFSAIKTELDNNAQEIAELDKAIGDGDHLVNLQRGLTALIKQQDELTQLDWSAALMKIGMTLMSTMGGASGSLLGSLFVSMAKDINGKPFSFASVHQAFVAGVESVKARGKADIGEKTMLDTLTPAINSLSRDVEQNSPLVEAMANMKTAAFDGMQSTKAMVATKGRASFLGERAIGHIDAGARTSQLILFVIADYLLSHQIDR